MNKAERFKLRFGKYKSPRFQYGNVVVCAVRGPIRIVGMTDGRIPWPRGVPVGKGTSTGKSSLVVYKGLAKAVRLEAAIAVRHWWGVAPCTIRKWKRALGVPAETKGTSSLRQAHAREPWFRAAQHKAWSVAGSAARRAKIAAARRGKARPGHVVAEMRERRLGTRASDETRQRMSETHKRRGTRPPWIGAAWAPWEDRLLGLPATEVAVKTGRTLAAVFNRRKVLKKQPTVARPAR